MIGIGKIKDSILEDFLRGRKVTDQQVTCLIEAEKQLRIYQSATGKVDVKFFELYLKSLKKIPNTPSETYKSIKEFLSKFRFSR